MGVASGRPDAAFYGAETENSTEEFVHMHNLRHCPITLSAADLALSVVVIRHNAPATKTHKTASSTVSDMLKNRSATFGKYRSESENS